MTLVELNLTHLLRCCMQRTLTVSWSATGVRLDGPRHRLGQRTVVLQLELLSPDSAMLEAWLESDNSVRNIWPRAVIPLACRCEDGFVHLDAPLNRASSDRRLFSLSFSVGPDHQLELLFAQTSLLKEAGFTGGSYDPPALGRAAAEEAVA
jgi:hypothetical protein